MFYDTVCVLLLVCLVIGAFLPPFLYGRRPLRFLSAALLNVLGFVVFVLPLPALMYLNYLVDLKYTPEYAKPEEELRADMLEITLLLVLVFLAVELLGVLLCALRRRLKRMKPVTQ